MNKKDVVAMNCPDPHSGAGSPFPLSDRLAASLSRAMRRAVVMAAGLLRLSRRNPVVFVFSLLVMLQLGVATVSINALSAVRAYVSAESLYSKG